MRYIGIILLILLALGLFFRISNLGYSDFQGDEAKVVDFAKYTNIKDLKWVISSQLKGPGQYVLAYIIGKSPYSFFDLEFNFRIIYTLFACIGLIIFYVFVNKNFRDQEKLPIFILFSQSGLLIALSKIVQYQPIILFFIPAVLLAFAFFIKKNKYIYLILSAVLCGLGLYFHFDILSIAIPIAIYLFINNKRMSLLYFSLIFAVVTLTGFSVLYTNANLKTVFDYLFYQRISGESDYDTIYYSIKLIQIYHPLYISFIFLISVMYYLLKNTNSNKLAFIVILWSGLFVYRIFTTDPSFFVKILHLILTGLMIFTLRKELLVYNLRSFLNIYLFSSLIFYLLIMTKPLTHIYGVLLPMSIISGYAVSDIKIKRLYYTFISVILIALLSFNYQAFYDTKPEYPWNNKNYLFGQMDRSIASGQKIDGVFGFPYNRKYKELNIELIDLSRRTGVKTYNSNEKEKITNYYVSNLIRSANHPEIFIYIKKPQSLDYAKVENGIMLIDKPEYSIYSIKY